MPSNAFNINASISCFPTGFTGDCSAVFSFLCEVNTDSTLAPGTTSSGGGGHDDNSDTLCSTRVKNDGNVTATPSLQSCQTVLGLIILECPFGGFGKLSPTDPFTYALALGVSDVPPIP
ncbi:hypothetical protein M422DRAFT_782606 [Sphaerobolus stellatus SS14]|uniref:Glycan binding protein Y3-like domain-containing protein n=1 Tax=Sphaerobolus stellatus (strain SS14) TaxID=990650 RepID=A0A0C9VCC0_SPHS4|nr:hypothetical protein M422DRAFT_782606 [Sphaerobolus stellatus SS14]